MTHATTHPARHYRFLLGVLGVLVAIASLAGGEAPTLAEIYSPKDELRFLGATHTLPTNDIEAFMKPIREHGYNAVMVHGLDDDWGATYPSKYFPFADWRNFEEDTLEKIIDTCHNEGVKVVVYAPLTMLSRDPRYIDIDPKTAEGWTSTPLETTRRREEAQTASLDSPFRDLLAGALKEICALGADGLWLDGYSMEGYNKVGKPFAHGAPVFKAETGLDWPMKEDWESDTFRRWVKWRQQHHLDNGQWIAEQVRADYPHVTLSFNTHFVTPLVVEADRDGPPLTWGRWREAVPIARFPDVLGASNHARLQPSNPAQSTPFWLNMSYDMNPLRCDLWQPTFTEAFQIGLRNMHAPGDGLGLRMSALAAFTFGCQIWPEGEIHTGKAMRPEIYTQINDAIHAREAWFGGERVPYCGVVLSNNTRDFWGMRYLDMGDPRNTGRLFTESYMGLISLLMSEQIPHSHLFDNTLDAASLDRFPVILLPNVACLSDVASAELQGYVERGGRLIATYKTSLYDEWGSRREDFALSSLFGVRLKEDRYERALDPPFWSRELADAKLNEGIGVFTWQTRRTVIETLPGVDVLATELGVLDRGTEGDQALAGSPVIVRNPHGQGEAIYFADDVTQGYYQAPFRSIKTILGNLIAKSTAPFSVEAPSQVITNAFWQEQGNRLVVHLLNLPPMSTRLFERSQADVLDDIVPVHDVTVRLPADRRPTSAQIQPGGDGLALREAPDGSWIIPVPKIEEHVMVVVTFGQ